MKASSIKLAASLALLTLTPALHASTGTWSGPTNGTWDTTATNWSGVSGTPWDSTNGPTNAAIFNTASLAAPVSGTVYTNGITFNTNGGLGGSGTINLAGLTPTITVNTSSSSSTIASILDGTAGLTKNGTGILNIDAANTYIGTTTINTGEINLRNSSGLGATGAGNGTVVASGAMLRVRGNIAIGNEPLSIAGTGVGGLGALRTQSDVNSWGGKITLTASATIVTNGTNNGTMTFDVASGNAIEGNNVTLTISGSGTTKVNDPIDLGTSGALIIENTNGSTGVNLNAANPALTNTTSLKNGPLSLGHVNALQNSTLETNPTGFGGRALNFTVPGTNTYNLGGFSGDLAINIGGNTLSVGANNANTTNTGILSGAGGLTKVGNGTLTLGNLQAYTGATTVSAGTLAVIDSISQSTTIDVQSGANLDVTGVSGGFTIATGQTLKGNGNVLGATTVNGTLSPGASPGTLTFNNALTFGSSGSLTIEIGGTNPGEFDKVAGITNLTLDGTFTVSLFGGFSPVPGNSFDVLDWSGALTATGFTVGTDLILPSLALDYTWDTSAFTTTGTVAVVPEPGSAALLLGGLAIFACRRRKQ